MGGGGSLGQRTFTSFILRPRFSLENLAVNSRSVTSALSAPAVALRLFDPLVTPTRSHEAKDKNDRSGSLSSECNACLLKRLRVLSLFTQAQAPKWKKQ